MTAESSLYTEKNARKLGEREEDKESGTSHMAQDKIHSQKSQHMSAWKDNCAQGPDGTQYILI